MELFFFSLSLSLSLFLFEKIFKLQKWAIRTISLEHYRSHTGPLFKKHNVLNVFDSFKLGLGVFMYKHQTKLLRQTFFKIILLNITKFIRILQETPKIIVFIKPKKCHRSICSNNQTNFMEFIRYHI